MRTRSVIAYAFWSYYRFNLSLRDVEDLLAARGSYGVITRYGVINIPKMKSRSLNIV